MNWLTRILPPEQQPPIPQAKGAYTLLVVSDEWVTLSGMLPFRPDGTLITGRVGADVTVEQAALAARQAIAGGIRVLQTQLGDDALPRLRWMRLEGFVRSAQGFSEQHVVMNGASDLVAAVFGDNGRCARMALGVSELPLGAAVEVAAQLRLIR